MSRKAFAYPLLLLVVIVTGCASGGTGAGGVSLDQEWQLGQQMAAQVAQQTRFVNDTQAVEYVREVG